MADLSLADQLRALHANIGWHRPELLAAADRLDALEQEKAQAQHLLALAAQEIACAGPVHERIRVLKESFSVDLSACRQALAEAQDRATNTRNGQLARIALARAEAAEAERDRLRTALEQIAQKDMRVFHDSTPFDMRAIATAALEPK